MTKSTITRERLQELAEGQSGFNLRTATHEESQELARMALSAMDSEPFAYIIQDKYERERGVEGHLSRSHVSKYVSQEDINEHEITCTPLYRHAQQLVVDIEPTQMFGIGSIFKPQVVSEREADCDDCAHYNPKICHGEGCPAISQQSVQPAPVVPDIDELRLAFEAAERESGDGFNLHKYGIGYADDETQGRWDTWLSCRAAMLQAGNFRENANSSTNNCREIPETSTNSPVIPDGYNLCLVPMEHTEAFNAACTAAFNEFERGTGPCGVFMAGHRAMLASARKEVK